jgi:hypothetical protein
MGFLFSDLRDADATEADFDCGLVNHGHEGDFEDFVDCEEVALEGVFTGNAGMFPPKPYDEASLAKFASQFLTGVDDGLEDKLTVKVLLSLDSDELIVAGVSTVGWANALDLSEWTTR